MLVSALQMFFIVFISGLLGFSIKCLISLNRKKQKLLSDNYTVNTLDHYSIDYQPFDFEAEDVPAFLLKQAD